MSEPTGLAMSGGSVEDAAKKESSKSRKKHWEAGYHEVAAKELLDLTTRMRALRDRIGEGYAKSVPVARQSAAIVTLMDSLKAELNARFMVERGESLYTNKTPYYPDNPAPKGYDAEQHKATIPEEAKTPGSAAQSEELPDKPADMFGGEGEG